MGRKLVRQDLEHDSIARSRGAYHIRVDIRYDTIPFHQKNKIVNQKSGDKQDPENNVKNCIYRFFLWIFIFKLCYVIDFNQIVDKWVCMSMYASDRRQRDWTQNHFVIITEFFG